MEQGLGMDLRDCSKWTCGYVELGNGCLCLGWGGGEEEGRIKLNPLIFFPFGVHIKEGYHIGVFWLIRLHHISSIPYRDEQKRNRGINAENSKDEWPSLHRLPPFLPCK